MVLGGRAFEQFLRRGAVLWHAVRPFEQQDAELVGGLGIAEVAGEPEPARGFEIVFPDRRAIVVDFADQRHRRGVLGIFIDPPLGLLERDQKIAALVGAESKVRGLPIGARRQWRRRCGNLRSARDRRDRSRSYGLGRSGSGEQRARRRTTARLAS